MASAASIRREQYAEVVEELTLVEQLVDPHSPFGYVVFERLIDDNGDPLDLLLRAEEGDEVAAALLWP